MATYSEIQTAINNLTSSSTLEDMFTWAACTSQVTVDRVIVVSTINDLPDLLTTPISVGTMFFIDQYKTIVVANGYKWVGLDNRLLRRDSVYGDIWSTGIGTNGRLGNNSVANATSFVSAVNSASTKSWCHIAAGKRHALAVRGDGTLWAWGLNYRGRLGDNTTVDKSSPVSVVGGFTNWKQVGAGYNHSIGLRSNGTVWTWGCSDALGAGAITVRSSPGSIDGGFTDWCFVAGGSTIDRSAAIRTNGSLWMWGANNYGSLGDNTTVGKNSPVSVVGGFTDWCAVSTGFLATAAVRTNGTLWTWGGNFQGQLGDNTIVSKSSPVSVVGGFTDWCQVSVGGDHMTAIRTNGTLWAWGNNNAGQLGDGTTVSKSSPVSVIGGVTNWCSVTGATSATIGIKTDGTMWGWGSNAYCRLGQGSFGASPTLMASGTFPAWKFAASAYQNSFAIRSC